MSILVIVPTYNERENLEIIAGRLHDAVPEAQLLVVDDNSPDGTGKIADDLAEREDWVHVLHRTGKEGLGAAYLAGFAWAREHDYDVVVEMDADGSHAPEQLPRLLAALQHADVVIGSRWVDGGTVVNWPKSREILSRGGNAYTRLALGMPVRDATGGYRAYRREVLDPFTSTDPAIAAPIASQGYCFQVDLAWQITKAGHRMVEVPITFMERERGESKMSRSIVAEALWRVTVWGVRHRLGRDRVGQGRKA